MATDQGVGGSNPLAHVVIWPLGSVSEVFYYADFLNDDMKLQYLSKMCLYFFWKEEYTAYKQYFISEEVKIWKKNY